MTTEETKQLEYLLAKLSTAVNSCRCGVVHNYMHDGYYIAKYDTQGEIEGEAIAPSIEKAIEKLNKR